MLGMSFVDVIWRVNCVDFSNHDALKLSEKICPLRILYLRVILGFILIVPFVDARYNFDA